MTLNELITLNRKNDGKFFDKNTLKSRREKLKDFKIVAQNKTHLVLERNDGAHWVFQKSNGRVVHDVSRAEVEGLTK